MKTYTFKNITNGEAYIAHLEYEGCYTGPLCNFVEEQLYILWELTPCANRCSWAYPFLRGERVKFTYHNCEFVWVWLDEQGQILVKDISYAQLRKALLETHKVELDIGDDVELQQNYCEPTIVDVVVTDHYTGKQFTFHCFDTFRGTFPY